MFGPGTESEKNAEDAPQRLTNAESDKKPPTYYEDDSEFSVFELDPAS